MQMKNFPHHMLFINWFLSCLLICSSISCKKFLSEKPDQKINTPSTLTDLQNIADYSQRINSASPVISEMAAGDYYLLDADWNGLSENRDRNYYTWGKEDEIMADWNFPYEAINNANVILDYLPQITIEHQEQMLANQLKGTGYFVRAFYHYQLSQLFTPVYNKPSADKDLGLPLRLTSDINAKTKRLSVEETYESIINDTKEAIQLLPSLPIYKTRPSKAAAFGLLARVYLSMQEYELAGIYADSCLQSYGNLMDYNTLNANASIPFVRLNDEVIFEAETITYSNLSRARGRIDTLLYKSYEDGDIRKEIFFIKNSDGSYGFKGNYSGLNSPIFFTGIATDEIYLIRSECNARVGKITEALTDLNFLLSKRWETGKFQPVNTIETNDLLRIIVSERRKELVSRTLRWTDLRRLNKEEQFAVTLYRRINGQIYELEPGNLRYTFQISRSSVSLGGLQQNP